MRRLYFAAALTCASLLLVGCQKNERPPRPTETPRPGFVTPTPLPRAAAGECNFAAHPDAVNSRGDKAAKGDAVIKGTVTTGGVKIYFVPGMRRYAVEKMEASGSRWFCNEQEALDAGWRASASLREPLPTPTITPFPRFNPPTATPRP